MWLPCPRRSSPGGAKFGKVREEDLSLHDGWDPESTRTIAGNERYPFYRYLTFGANLGF